MSGEYTDPTDPDTPLSFYVKDGKLVVESERRVPTELKPVSATEFAHSRFEGDDQIHAGCGGPRRERGYLRSAGGDFQPHRRAGPSSLSRLPAHRGDDSHARRRQAARGVF
jgi:hypothetical protein